MLYSCTARPGPGPSPGPEGPSKFQACHTRAGGLGSNDYIFSTTAQAAVQHRRRRGAAPDTNDRIRSANNAVTRTACDPSPGRLSVAAVGSPGPGLVPRASVQLESAPAARGRIMTPALRSDVSDFTLTFALIHIQHHGVNTILNSMQFQQQF